MSEGITPDWNTCMESTEFIKAHFDRLVYLLAKYGSKWMRSGCNICFQQPSKKVTMTMES